MAGAAVTLMVVRGDLLDQRVDAIVNAWNRNFIPWWLLLPQGVSGAIKKRGGFDPFRELSKAGTLKPGDAVLTSAGRLPFKGIIHVAGLSMFWRSSEVIVKRCVQQALQLAGRAGFQSVAFPLIGAGTGGLSAEQSKAVIVSAIEASGTTLACTVVEYGR
ncbi:MAG: macro domain-containing protein [Phycisphaerales bacterium]